MADKIPKTTGEKNKFAERWRATLSRTQELHRIGHKAGLLRKRLKLTAGSRSVI